MIKKLIATTAIALAAIGFTTSASAYAVYQDGLGMDVTYSTSGQTATFLVTADFTNATSKNWINDTMDSFSLAFNAKASDVTKLSGILDTNTSGDWTGSLSKVNANGCTGGSASNACYSVLPGGTGGDGATVIAATTYYWTFEMTFKDSVDLDTALAGSNSIKFLAVEQNTQGKWVNGGQLSKSGLYQEGCTNPLGCDPTPPVSVPEPISLALMGAGLFGIGLVQRRRRTHA